MGLVMLPWIDIGAQDVGNLLGLKPAQKAFCLGVGSQ